MKPPHHEGHEELMPGCELNRRDFLKRAGVAIGVSLGACGLGLALRDAKGPAAMPESKALAGLGDFSLPASGQARMAIVRGQDRTAMVEQGLRPLGGMEAFIKKGDQVLIKVNAAFATSASLGATTHPDVLAVAAKLCFAAGAAKVLVTDNPINNPESCFEISGLASAARSSGAIILPPKAGLFAPVSLPGAKLIRDWPTMAGVFKDVTKVLVLSPVKDHQRAGASMTLKNFYGFLGGRRNVFHQDINGIVTELSKLLKPTLCIMDGTVSMMSNGPTGGSLSDLKDTGTMVLSTDPVAADAVGLELLGRGLSDVPYVKMAEAAGAGVADYSSLNPVRIDTGA
jgi:uncharacterized protein (DUF362 family)